MTASSSSTLVVACAQMRAGRDPAANIAQATQLVREAAAGGALYVQTPEISNVVNRDRAGLFAVLRREEDDPMLASMRTLARELRIVLHLGSLAILRPDGKVANRAFVIGPDGDVAARYDKIHLFDVDLPHGETWRESSTFTGGDEAVLAGLPQAVLGLSICYDVRFPQLYRALAEAGAQILSAPACFTRQTGEAHWQVLQRARAIETGSFMVSAAQAGLHEDGRETWGHSIIVDPWGRVMAEAEREPGVILAAIDLEAVHAARERIPSLRHGRPFTVRGPVLASGRAAE